MEIESDICFTDDCFLLKFCYCLVFNILLRKSNVKVNQSYVD